VAESDFESDGFGVPFAKQRSSGIQALVNVG